MVAPDGPVAPDVGVHVFVETLNADDRAALRSSGWPTVAVLNKADLTGFGGDGPMAAAARRCRDLQRACAVPTRPLSALLAVAATDPAVLDPAMLDALQTLASAPAAVSGASSRRAATELDLFGTACAVSAVRAGAAPEELAGLLRDMSGIDGVCAEIGRAAAVVRYRRLTEAPPQGTDDHSVLTRMAAATDVVRAAGAPDIDCLTRADHLRRAVHWQRYARGPVSALHRACATDISRGALRLWARAGAGLPR